MNSTEAQRLIDAIEAELKRLGWWSAKPIPEYAFENMGPFGQNTMSFSQWLQFVFVPRVRECLQYHDWPSGSSVGTYAVRELDGQAEASELTSLLCEFDHLFH